MRAVLKYLRGSGGSPAIEFIIVGPFIIMFILLVIETGWTAFLDAAVRDALSHTAARKLTVGDTGNGLYSKGCIQNCTQEAYSNSIKQDICNYSGSTLSDCMNKVKIELQTVTAFSSASSKSALSSERCKGNSSNTSNSNGTDSTLDSIGTGTVAGQIFLITVCYPYTVQTPRAFGGWFLETYHNDPSNSMKHYSMVSFVRRFEAGIWQ